MNQTLQALQGYRQSEDDERTIDVDDTVGSTNSRLTFEDAMYYTTRYDNCINSFHITTMALPIGEASPSSSVSSLFQPDLLQRGDTY